MRHRQQSTIQQRRTLVGHQPMQPHVLFLVTVHQVQQVQVEGLQHRHFQVLQIMMQRVAVRVVQGMQLQQLPLMFVQTLTAINRVFHMDMNLLDQTVLRSMYVVIWQVTK